MGNKTSQTISGRQIHRRRTYVMKEVLGWSPTTIIYITIDYWANVWNVTPTLCDVIITSFSQGDQL